MNNQRIYGAILIVLIVPILCSAAEVRTWTSADGRFQIQAEFLKIEDDKVDLRKSNGSVISIPLAKLS
ncbi:MAG: SHD1 domain-containing protein [Planctomycetales bacterium]